jgi:hypothetical protein
MATIKNFPYTVPLIFVLAACLMFALAVACDSGDDDDEEEDLSCDVGTCSLQGDEDQCQEFEVSCSDKKVSACSATGPTGRGCCMDQEMLEDIFCAETEE